jgi:phosphoribosyl-ATP pyrophosphohydrolase/phosphoribosyl-AMP cyclohydrolase
MKNIIKTIDFSKNTGGRIPAIIQDHITKQVLMLGYMTAESLEKTLTTKNVWFYSRSKKRLWMKGETSNNILKVVDIKTDCDNDALLVSVIPKGPTCHTGETSCFGEEEKTEEGNVRFLRYLFEVIKQRKTALPKGSYTASLFRSGLDRIVQKVGEEATEVVIAAKNEEKEQVVEETADLMFHILVMLVEKGISLEQLIEQLQKRHT